MQTRPTIDEYFGDCNHICNCCQTEDVALKIYECRNFRDRDKEFKALCGICAGTMIGTYIDFPDQHSDTTMELGKLIANIGNRILKKLDKIEKLVKGE